MPTESARKTQQTSHSRNDRKKGIKMYGFCVYDYIIKHK